MRVPFIVRNPYESKRGIRSEAMISHIDITPSLLDFAGGLDAKTNGPAKLVDANKHWRERGENLKENRNGRFAFTSYHGKSWIDKLGDPKATH